MQNLEKEKNNLEDKFVVISDQVDQNKAQEIEKLNDLEFR